MTTSSAATPWYKRPRLREQLRRSHAVDMRLPAALRAELGAEWKLLYRTIYATINEALPPLPTADAQLRERERSRRYSAANRMAVREMERRQPRLVARLRTELRREINAQRGPLPPLSSRKSAAA